MAQTAYTLPTGSRTGHHWMLKCRAKVSVTIKINPAQQKLPGLRSLLGHQRGIP